MNSSVDGKETKCNVCEHVFSQEEDLVLHCRARKLDETKYACCKCSKVFGDKYKLNVHIRHHTGEKPFECKICGKRFAISGNVQKHMRTHTGERNFECEDCGRKFTQLVHLQSHKKMHSGETPFGCDFCQTAFKTKIQLRRHVRIHVAEYPDLADSLRRRKPKKTLFCYICGSIFTGTSHLRKHLTTHAGYRPYSCTLCISTFSFAQNLKRHMLTHTEEKPYKCNECDKSFRSLQNLTRHSTIHTGERPFTCDICQKSFALRATLTDHITAKHEKKRPYSCQQCGKTFSVRSVLYRHAKKHPENFFMFKEQVIKQECSATEDFPSDEPEFKSDPEQHTESNNICKIKEEHIYDDDDTNINEQCIKEEANYEDDASIEGSYPYMCIHCDSSFSSVESMVQHMATHTDGTPFCDNAHRTTEMDYNEEMPFPCKNSVRNAELDLFDGQSKVEPMVNGCEYDKMDDSTAGADIIPYTIKQEPLL